MLLRTAIAAMTCACAVLACGGRATSARDTDEGGSAGSPEPMPEDAGSGAVEAMTPVDTTGVVRMTPLDDAGNNESGDTSTPVTDADVILPRCGPPTFMPTSGYVVLGSTITISPPIGFPTTGGFIYYTIDGTPPSYSSPVYLGPIQITSSSEAILAFASAPHVCTDSTIASAAYTATSNEPPFNQVLFSPQSTTQNNDFLVLLSAPDPNARICFTTDGITMPTCNITATAATCGSASTTYKADAGLDAMGSVSITSAITDPMTGQVLIQGISCTPGSVMSSVSSQHYTLQVSNPTMQNPAPGNLAFSANGYAPSISSQTSGASLHVTIDGTTATCSTSALLGDGGNPANPAQVHLTTSTIYSVVGCKNGYAPSIAETFAYSIGTADAGLTD